MRKEDRELARKLAPEAVEPPEDLLARLKADIPEELPAFIRRDRRDDDSGDGDRDEGRSGRVLRFPTVFGMSGATLLKAAATVVLAVGAGFLALQVQRRVPDPQVQEATAPAGDAAMSRALEPAAQAAPKTARPEAGESAPPPAEYEPDPQDRGSLVQDKDARDDVELKANEPVAPSGEARREARRQAANEAVGGALAEENAALRGAAPRTESATVPESPPPPPPSPAPPMQVAPAPPPARRMAPEPPEPQPEGPIWVGSQSELAFREGSAEAAAPRLRKQLDQIEGIPETDAVYSLPDAPPPPVSEPAAEPERSAAGPPPDVAPTQAVRDLQIDVRYDQDEPLPGAVLRLQDSEGHERQTIADAKGRAYFYDIPVGEYEVRAELEGFQTVITRVQPPVTEKRELAVDLPLASVQEEIVVVAETPEVTSSAAAMVAGVSTGEGAPLVVQPGADVGDAFGKRKDRPPVPENPLVDTAYDSLSTFGLDVDTGTYGLLRAHLTEGTWPEPSTVRIEELLNAFDYGDPQPAEGDFSIAVQGAPSPFRPGVQLLRLGVKAREVTAENRKPAALTFVVDVSGSMQEPNKLELAKQALGLLLDQLEPGDTVALVTYGSEARTVLRHTADKEAVRQALEALGDEGSTNAEAGLRLGYEAARRAFRPGAVNRIVLCSDGVANVGVTDPQEMLETVGEEARNGIELTTLGFGMGTYNDHLMEQLADKGDGRYAYLDDLVEAHRVLVEELTGTVQTIARDARVQFELNPGTVKRYRLLGYENRDIEDYRFRYDDQDAGEIGSGHSVTVLYELELEPVVPDTAALGVLRLRWWSVEQGKFLEIEKPVYRRDLAGDWHRAAPALKWSAVTARFAQVLRGHAVPGELPGLVSRMQGLVSQAWPADARRAEMVDLVREAAEIQRLQQAPGVP